MRWKSLQELVQKRNNIALLHCNTEYPTPYADVNLQAMCTIRQAFQLETGYSDHTDGLEVPIAAVALGAESLRSILLLVDRWWARS